MNKLLSLTLCATISLQAADNNSSGKISVKNTLTKKVALQGLMAFGMYGYSIEPSETRNNIDVIKTSFQKGFWLKVASRMHPIYQVLAPNEQYTIQEDAEKGFILVPQDQKPIFLKSEGDIPVAPFLIMMEEKLIMMEEKKGKLSKLSRKGGSVVKKIGNLYKRTK